MTDPFQKEISCRVTRTLLMYVRENNRGNLGGLLDGLGVDEAYLMDANNWISHGFLQILYDRMIDMLADASAVYKMTLAAERFQSLGILDRIARLLGGPKLIYSQAPRYNRLLKLNGDVHIREIGDTHVVLEDRYHDSRQKTRHDCDYTRGILAGIPTMFGLPEASVTEIECQVAQDVYGERVWEDRPRQGAAGCLYRVDWTNRRPFQFFKRFASRRHIYRQAIEDLQEANRKIQEKYEEVKRIASDLGAANKKLIQSREQIEKRTSELKASETRYRKLAENVSDTIWRFDLRRMTFDYISPSVFRSRGFTQQEAMALGLDATLSPGSLETVTALLTEELARDGAAGVDPDRSKTIEIQHSCKDGTFVWAEATVSFIRDEAKRPVGLLGVSRDIHRRKKAEKALRESEERYRQLFTHAPAGIIEADFRTGKFTDANDVVCAYLGYSREEILDLGPWDILTDGSMKVFNERLEKRLNGNQLSDQFEYKIRDRSGHEIWVLTNTRDIYEDGKLVGATAVLHDITEQKLSQKALKESEEKFKMLSEKAPLGIALIGKEGKYHYVNSKFTDIFGYTTAEIPDGRAWFAKAYPDPEYRKAAIASWTADLEKAGVGETRPQILYVTCKDGGEKAIHFRSVTLQDSRELVFYEDITDKKKLEEQLQQTQKMEAIGSLAGGIAHDFNNLLMGIQGHASLIAVDLDPSSPHAEHVSAIEEYIQSATNLTNQLLGFARGGKYEVKPTDINDLMQKNAAMFGRTKKEIGIHTKLQMPAPVVMADRKQIEQVLLNLYINAWQAMPDGGNLFLESRVTTLDAVYCRSHQVKPGRYARVSVTDTGFGMDSATRQQIFDPFFTTKDKGRGTGLGLASAYGIVKNHGGMITVYSEVGHGTTFNIYLPLSEREIHTEAVPLKKLFQGSETILLVDDEPMIVDVGKAMLEKLGYRVVVADGGRKAIATILEMKDGIELVILDMIMPGMDGGKVFDRIREIQPDLPVMLSSGYAMNEQVTEIIRRGCSGFIQKPFNIAELSEKVRVILDDRR